MEAGITVSVEPVGMSAKEVMRELLEQVKPKKLQQRLLKVWGKR